LLGINPPEGNLDGHSGFVRTDDGIAIGQVETGLSDWSQTEIVSGLAAGEEVLVFATSRAVEQSRQFERRKWMAIPGLRK